MALPAPFYRYRSEIEAELRSVVGESDLPLYNMMRYHLGWVDEQGHPRETSGGKLLRPTLCLLACEAVGGKWQRAVPAAAAIELVHNFSLIHDDIQDVSPERRHRPTVWWLWGQAQAINAGDGMYALAQLSLPRLESRSIPGEKVVQASTILAQACLKLCEGQYLDVSFENRLDVGMDDYLEMISGKTAQLFECSLHLGALLGTESEGLKRCLCSFGRKLGLAYQMWDDLLGIWGDETIIGKSAQSDIKERKKSLPVVYALEKARDKEREELVSIYLKQTLNREDVAEVAKILDRLGARDYTERMVEQYYLQALQGLEEAELPPSARDELRQVAAFILGREE